MPDRRFQSRETDSGWRLFLAAVVRAPRVARSVVALLTGLGLGGLIGAGVMRFFLITRLLAQDVEHRALIDGVTKGLAAQEERIAILEGRFVALETHASILIRAECLRTSKADHTLLQMPCPPELYRGAPR